MRRIVLLGSTVLLGAAAGLSIHLVTAAGTAAKSGLVTIHRTGASPAGPALSGRRLSGVKGGPERLAVPASAPLVGSVGPIGSESPNGAYLAYNTWHWRKGIDWKASLDAQGIQTGDPLGTPTLWLRDLRTGTETALEPGTMSTSWRADGALAYVRGTEADYRANTPYLRDVVVRSSAVAAPVVWSSSPGRYLVQGWAGRRLIVRLGFPGGSSDMIVFDGPGSSRTLAENAELIAIGPGGRTALVAESPANTFTPAVRLVAVADGRELARVPFAAILDPVERTPLTSISGPGHWLGDRVVATGSAGLVIFHASGAGASLSVEQVLHIDAATKPEGALYEPRFTDGDRTIVAWEYLPTTANFPAAQFVCDRYARTCEKGASVDSTAAPRPIYDESGGDQ